MVKKLLYPFFCLLALSACKIENDIPYPIVDGSIEAFEVEGQCDADGNSSNQTTIDKSGRTVSLYVDDTVDLTDLRITKLTVTNNATLGIDSALCHNYAKFPTMGFGSTDDLITSADTRVNFSQPVILTLTTYQDYPWKITVQQVVKREIILENQVGSAIVDEINRNVIIYVSEEQPLDRIKVTSFKLGGTNGSVSPDPSASDTYNFSKPATFFVRNGWEETSLEWTVYVYHSDGEAETSGDVFARATSASLSGSIQSGKRPSVAYKKNGETGWTTQPDADITVNGTSFTTTLTGLTPGMSYQYRVEVDGTEKSSGSFTTAAAIPLENGSMEEWSQDGKQWNPWAAGDDAFWGTGNKGSSILSSIGNITSPTDESVSGKAAYLESKDAMLKLAAGNLFIGDFDLDGTNGLLHFGRPFTSFPTALRLYYKYTPSIISIVGSSTEGTLPSSLKNMVGQSDLFQIYIALSDKSEPYEIRNNPKNRHLFDPNDANIIAYGEYTSSESVTSYKELKIPLEYRATNRTPKYIIIVASSSKYGDYYLGGVGSKLWLDEMELVYE